MSHRLEHIDRDLTLDDGNGIPAFVRDGRLLVVDDEESLRITTAAILEKEGYNVDTASSGDEAIALLEGKDYDLVLTDLHMEGGDGLSVLNQIREFAVDDLRRAHWLCFRRIGDRRTAGRRLRLSRQTV